MASLGVPRIRHQEWTVRMPTAGPDHLVTDKNGKGKGKGKAILVQALKGSGG